MHLISMKDKLNISSPDFWNTCYENNETGWDLGSPTPIFVDWCNKLSSSKKICVPGAGNGYDSLYFASKGHQVTAIDFADIPIRKLNEKTKNKDINIEIICQNFFDLGTNFFNKFDYVVEYTFYCAIDPSLRYEYIEIVHKILKPRGEFIAILLPLNKDPVEGGPPFNVNLDQTINLLLKKFTLLESINHPLSIEPRKDNEQFVRFIK